VGWLIRLAIGVGDIACLGMAYCLSIDSGFAPPRRYFILHCSSSHFDGMLIYAIRLDADRTGGKRYSRNYSRSALAAGVEATKHGNKYDN